MRVVFGTTDVPTAGTEVQVSNTQDRVKSISFRARPANVGNAFLGHSAAVTSTNGWTLQPGEEKTIDFGKGSVLFSTFYVDVATNGDDIDWCAILE